MRKFKNSSIKWGPYISIHQKSNQAITKTVLPTSPQQQVLMQLLWTELNKISIKCFKITIQNQSAETTIKYFWLHKDRIRMVFPSLTSGLMESYQIFRTTANIAYVRKKATNQMQRTKIRWEEALNVESLQKNYRREHGKFKFKYI